MKTMRSRKEPGSFEAYASAKATLLHRCSVCSTVHEVSAVRVQFAYGRQLACSPDCEAERRRRSRAEYRRAPVLVTDNVFAKPLSIARYPSPAGRNPTPLKSMISDCAPSSAALKTAEEASSEGSRAAMAGVRNACDSPNQRTRHLAPAGEHKAAISATVESTDILCVRRAIFQAGGESVDILKTAPVPHSTKVRVFIGMKLGALDSIMTAIMRSVTACEFGRVVRM
jgi:hypothetical protein